MKRLLLNFPAVTFFLIISFLCDACLASISTGNRSSVIKINAGSGFVVEGDISDYGGKLITETGASLEGENITFNNGSLEEAGNNIKFSGALNSSNQNKIILDGHKKFIGQSGKVFQQIEIGGIGNSIEGDFVLQNDIVFQDACACLDCSVKNKLNGNIRINGGSLFLDDDLSFNDVNRIYGPGKISLAGYKLSFGASPITFSEPLYFDCASDISINSNIHLQEAWTFSGSSVIIGNNNIFSLDNDLGGIGKIIIEKGSSLLIKNVTLRHVNGDSFFCMDNAGTISFQNVTLILDDDYTFSLGRFFVLDALKIVGRHKFVYQTNQQSSIDVCSQLILDQGVTFSYDPGNMRKDLLAFEDATSILEVNGAEIYATLTGMQLTKGTVIFGRYSYLSCEKNSQLDEGITFGNDIVEDDCYFQVLNGSTVNVKTGSIKYRNVGANSFIGMNGSAIDVCENCNVYLYQDLNLGNGVLSYRGRGGFFTAAGKQLYGSFVVIGYLDYLTI